MNIFAPVGPFGCGKTTFCRHLISSLATSGYDTSRIAFVLNDEGGWVDGGILNGQVSVFPMTNGCFTCDDAADLLEMLHARAEEGYEWVLLEGFGITSGAETKMFLEQAGYPYHILCILSESSYPTDVVDYGQVIPTQIRATTLGVGVTKQITSLLDPANQLVTYVGAQQPGVRIFSLPPDSMPDWVMRVFHGAGPEMHIQSSAQTCSCGHKHHHHAHHEHHVHGVHTYSYPLRHDVTIDDVRCACEGASFLKRIKGSASGQLFNGMHGDWRSDGVYAHSYITFYTLRPVDIASDLPRLLPLLLVEPTGDTDTVPSYQLMRTTLVSRGETVNRIQAYLEQMPLSPVLVPASGGRQRLITHPEQLQVVKEMARRPSVLEEWFPQVLHACSRYWIACVRYLDAHATLIPEHELPKNRCELAVSLVWWCNRYGAVFGRELIDEATSLQLGTMAAAGMLALTRLHTDPQAKFWQHAELTEALMWGKENGESLTLLIAAAQHAISLAEADTELKHRWCQTLTSLEVS